MAAHLGDGQIVEGQTLTAAMDADLPVLLRSCPADDRDDELASSAGADAVLTRWRKKKWVHRSADPRDPRIERYQLTSGAHSAVRQVRDLRRRTSIATGSALTIVMSELHHIATEANPDRVARRQAIDDRIAVLVAQRDALDGGEDLEVDHGELVDKVATLAELIDRIPADVAGYGERMHANTAALLRQSLSDDAMEFAESLQRMFDGHDVIAESPEGQAFRAFATLIATPSQRAQLERDITEIVDRVEGLPAHLKGSLIGFIDAMWQRVREVEEIRGVAFRRMSNFVRGGDLTHYRSMRTRISEAQASAALAFQHTHASRDIGFVVPMSGVDTNSVGRLRLDQGTATVPAQVQDTSAEFAIDPATLVGRESIDWNALREAVHAAMDAHSGFATLSEVLEMLPAPRTGDIIGLWSLATRYGEVDDDATASVWAATARGYREIDVPYAIFGERIPAPAAPSRGPRSLDRQLTLTEELGDE
ncbi:DUF3375 family protein [Nocardia miyunensis]|uniref:DUF3375 family protein n=1 Tax=Nocardia miyunensis TaxID=282684 RepID=UPI001FE1628D|nr:DUF3375 family protein [Nocardia miyunensis]